MVDALKRGDRVVTSGGLIGTIQRIVSEREAVLEVGDGVRVRIMRGMISEVMAKTEPLAADDKAEKAEKKAPTGPTYWSMLGVPRARARPKSMPRSRARAVTLRSPKRSTRSRIRSSASSTRASVTTNTSPR